MRFLFIIALLSMTSFAFAMEPICESVSGNRLAFRVTSIEVSEAFSKRLQTRFDELCKKGSPAESVIIPLMADECITAAKELEPTQKKKVYAVCLEANRRAVSFQEGLKFAEKSEKCENPGSVSSLDRSVKEISDSVKKKETKKSKASAQ